MDAIKFFVDVTRWRADGDDYIHRFFESWNDLTSHTKAGQVAHLRRSLRGGSTGPAMAKRKPKQKGRDGESTVAKQVIALPCLPDRLSFAEWKELFEACLFGVTYVGPYAPIIAHYQGLSTPEQTQFVDFLHKKMPPHEEEADAMNRSG
jgi:hypothetical protein